MKITEALVLEHRVFAGVFDRIERALPRLTTVAEAQTLAAVVEGLLAEHGATETNLAYLALDHVLHDQGRLDRLHQEHQEIDDRLRRVHAAGTRDEACHLLAGALQATREHMEFEEQAVFPLLERAVGPMTLTGLGEIRLRHASLATAPP
jgi:hemerythrin-like domain-containing protein